MGINPEDAQIADGQYNITKDKKIEVLIDVWQQEDKVFAQFMSPVAPLKDPSRSEVLKMLLEENHHMVESSFAVINDHIFVKETMECSFFFSQEWVITSISRIAFYSEAYQQKWST